MSLAGWIDFKEMSEPGLGALVALEGGRTIPFDIKRVYYLYKLAPHLRRGMHAHKSLKQVIICVAGQCRISLDNGKAREQVYLDNPSRGLVLEHVVWREMFDFSHDCVLLVLASELYDEADYIRNYDDFLAYYQSNDR
jgi:hypothetical protein